MAEIDKDKLVAKLTDPKIMTPMSMAFAKITKENMDRLEKKVEEVEVKCIKRKDRKMKLRDLETQKISITDDLTIYRTRQVYLSSSQLVRV